MSVLFGQTARENLRKAIKILIRQLSEPSFKKLHEKTVLRCAQNTHGAWRKPGWYLCYFQSLPRHTLGKAAIVNELEVTAEVSTIFANAAC